MASPIPRLLSLSSDLTLFDLLPPLTDILQIEFHGSQVRVEVSFRVTLQAHATKVDRESIYLYATFPPIKSSEALHPSDLPQKLQNHPLKPLYYIVPCSSTHETILGDREWHVSISSFVGIGLFVRPSFFNWNAWRNVAPVSCKSPISYQKLTLERLMCLTPNIQHQAPRRALAKAPFGAVFVNSPERFKSSFFLNLDLIAPQFEIWCPIRRYLLRPILYYKYSSSWIYATCTWFPGTAPILWIEAGLKDVPFNPPSSIFWLHLPNSASSILCYAFSWHIGPHTIFLWPPRRERRTYGIHAIPPLGGHWRFNFAKIRWINTSWVQDCLIHRIAKTPWTSGRGLASNSRSPSFACHTVLIHTSCNASPIISILLSKTVNICKHDPVDFDQKIVPRIDSASST